MLIKKDDRNSVLETMSTHGLKVCFCKRNQIWVNEATFNLFLFKICEEDIGLSLQI